MSTFSLMTDKSKQTLHPARKIPKVLLFYQDFGASGGIERYLQHTVRMLSQRGRFRPVVACSVHGQLYKQLKAEGYKIYGVWAWSFFVKAFWRIFDIVTQIQLVRILLREQPDLVHIHIGQAENLLFKLFKCPIVYTFHGYGTLYNLQATKNRLKRRLKKRAQPLFRILMPHVDAMLFVSNHERLRMIREGYLPKGVTGSVLYNGLPIQEIRREAEQTDRKVLRRELGIPEEARCVSFINRLEENKNPLRFIEMAEQLAQRPELGLLHFMVAGKGRLSEAVRQSVEKSPIRDRIHYLGYREDVPALLACSDLAVNMADHEPFGLGMLEAMATGTLCVTFASGGIVEVFSLPEADAFLVPAADYDAMREQIARMLQLPPERKAFLSGQLQCNAMKFDVSRFIEDLEAVYDRVLHKP